jgi:hypothetical protein
MFAAMAKMILSFVEISLVVYPSTYRLTLFGVLVLVRLAMVGYATHLMMLALRFQKSVQGILSSPACTYS